MPFFHLFSSRDCCNIIFVGRSNNFLNSRPISSLVLFLLNRDRSARKKPIILFNEKLSTGPLSRHEKGPAMKILEKLTKRYFEFYRRHLSLNRNNWVHYARTVPVMKETVPMKENILDSSWGFRPRIQG